MMDEKVLESLRKTIQVARECGDTQSLMVLLVVKALMLVGRSQAIFELLRPEGERMFNQERPWPAELEI